MDPSGVIAVTLASVARGNTGYLAVIQRFLPGGGFTGIAFEMEAKVAYNAMLSSGQRQACLLIEVTCAQDLPPTDADNGPERLDRFRLARGDSVVWCWRPLSHDERRIDLYWTSGGFFHRGRCRRTVEHMSCGGFGGTVLAIANPEDGDYERFSKGYPDGLGRGEGRITNGRIM